MIPTRQRFQRWPNSAALLIALWMVAPLANAEPRLFQIDPEHFSVGFLVEHAGYEHVLGLFREGGGEFVYDEEERALHSGRVTIQADSVDTDHDDRDEHLRSDEFLDADGHPTIEFEARDLSLEKHGHGQLIGDLTLLGKTRPVTLNVTVNKAAPYPFGDHPYVMGISARGSIQRSEFGMDYGVANDLVGDEVKLILEFEAIRQVEN